MSIAFRAAMALNPGAGKILVAMKIIFKDFPIIRKCQTFGNCGENSAGSETKHVIEW